MALVGRPRLDHDKTFRQGFARILPGLLDGTIGKGEAARRLNISHRSLNRYYQPYETQKHESLKSDLDTQD